MKPELTIVVLTYNRPDWISKTLKFLDLQKCPYQILILDGSRSENVLKNQKIIEALTGLTIDYRSYPSELSFCERMQDGLKFVKTKYSLVWTDDDFLVTGKLEEHIDFLEKNQDYSATIGPVLCLLRSDVFSKIFPISSYFLVNHLSHNESLVDKEVVRRIIVYNTLTRLASYPLFYALRRTKDLVEYVSHYYPNQTGVAQELTLVTLTLIDGKVKFFDSIYGFRNYSNEPIWTPTREVGTQYHNDADILKARELMSQKLCEKVPGVNASNVELACDQIVNYPYLKSDYSIDGNHGLIETFPYIKLIKIYSLLSNFFRLNINCRHYKIDSKLYRQLLKSLR